MSKSSLSFEDAKDLFHGVAQAIEDCFAVHGFIVHPLYENGWNDAVQAFHFHMISAELQPCVHQLKLSLCPQVGCFTMSVFRSNANWDVASLQDLPEDAYDWSAMWLKRPFVELSLLRPMGLNPLADRLYFPVQIKEFDPATELARVTRVLEQRIPYLIDALTHRADPRHVLANTLDGVIWPETCAPAFECELQS